MKQYHLKQIITIITVLGLLFSFSSVYSVADSEAQEFSLRGGIKFGMTPEQVIEIEKTNGFNYKKTRAGDTLYDAGDCYNLYYGDSDSSVGKLGDLPIMRFEYDFDKTNKQMFHFYYVFKGNDAFNYLAPALTEKYGEPKVNSSYSTYKYNETVTKSHKSHSRWIIPSGEQSVVIDLWDNEYDVCFLAYQIVFEKNETLDFGI